MTQPKRALVVLSILTSALVIGVQVGGLPLAIFAWWRLGFSAALLFVSFFVLTHWVLSPAAAKGLVSSEGGPVGGVAGALFLLAWSLAATVVALWLPESGPVWLRVAYFGVALSAAGSPIRLVLHKFNDAGQAYHPVVQEWIAWANAVALVAPLVIGIGYLALGAPAFLSFQSIHGAP